MKSELTGGGILALSILLVFLGPERGGTVAVILLGIIGCLLLVGLVYVGNGDDETEPEPEDEPTLYRYEVERDFDKSETVYAADVKTYDTDPTRTFFVDHDGVTMALYTHVLKVTGRKVTSDED